jgi:hypothetical protein
VTSAATSTVTDTTDTASASRLLLQPLHWRACLASADLHRQRVGDGYAASDSPQLEVDAPWAVTPAVATVAAAAVSAVCQVRCNLLLLLLLLLLHTATVSRCSTVSLH